MAATGLKPAAALFDRLPGALADLAFTGIATDSRRVRGGELFVGLRGTRGPADRYVKAALAAGASAVLLESDDAGLDWRAGRPVWREPAARALLGTALARYYDLSPDSVFIAGVTGTNGKSSVTHLLSAVLPQPGFIIGTLGWGLPGQLQAQANTTPDVEALHRTIAACREAGARSIAMEVSSHALDQDRIAGVPIQMAVFTNLSRDHLDYHGDMEAYFAAKASLFRRPGLRYAVINADDPQAQRLLALLPAGAERITYGLTQGEVRPRELTAEASGLRMTVDTPLGECRLHSPWIGRVNAYNLLAALAAALLLGETPQAAAERLAQVAPVPGRLQRVPGPAAAPVVVVDYAHTPDALDAVLADLRKMTAGQLWCVFGCGGDRDRGKRPQMGRIAETWADWVVVTDDNPRSEAPEAIVAEILGGMTQPAAAVRVHDRARAIQAAVRAARPGDCILIAGKGHENYQEQAGVRRPFDDAAVAQRALESWQC
ncbi:MAG: UDP-N-acetylmuramoyl-L-alanyl-D-glutamate--2,6-diaminopimelate ligase [Pseudomonadota bacterium]